MKRTGKKFLSLLLVLALAVSVTSIGVLAADESVSRTVLTSAGGELSSGNYYLASEVTLKTDITIPEDAEVTIDLNGHALKGTGTASAITNYGTFTLEDSSGTDSGTLTGTTNKEYTVDTAGVYNCGTFIMNGGSICNNKVGTAVTNTSWYEYEGVFIMNGGSISENNGSGVCSSGIFTMNGGTISKNSAYAGGGVYLQDGTFTINNGNISNNAASWGGGVCVDGGTFTMSDGTITGNTAGSGGGVQVGGYGGIFIMNNGTISNNSADSGGGVHLNNDGAFTMNNGTISDNTANGGGGVYNNETFTMNGGTIIDNSADGNGGGVYNGGTFTMDGGIISSNTAYYSSGGGVYNGGTFTMDGGTIRNNTANDNGGGVYNRGTFTMDGGTISSNTAISNGGGVYNDETFTMNGGTIIDNSAGGNGGGVNLNSNSTFTMSGGSISDNSAGGNGGGVYKNWNNRFYMSGSSIISGNLRAVTYGNETNRYFTENVYLDLDQIEDYPIRSYIQLDGPLTEGASIGVTTSIASSEGSPVQITSAESDTNYYASSAQYFFSDEGYGVRANTSGGYVELYGDKPESTVDETVNDGTGSGFDSSGYGGSDDSDSYIDSGSGNSGYSDDSVYSGTGVGNSGYSGGYSKGAYVVVGDSTAAADDETDAIYIGSGSSAGSSSTSDKTAGSTSGKEIVETGDDGRPLLVFALMLASVTEVAALALIGRKKVTDK